MATNTAASFTNHTGNGSAGPFNVSFSYLSEAEVDVTVGGVLKTITTHYTFTSATQITFTSGNEPGNGVAIKFQRDTAIGSKKVDFVDGSVLTEIDLDNNANQLLFSMQEIVDSGIGSSVQSVSGTTPIVSSGGTTPAISISAATTSAAGSMSASDKTKLDGIEASATADQTASEIRTLVESASDSNVFTDADHTKLNAIEASATADQTASEIRTLVESATDSNVFTDADHTKLNAIEASATADQTGAEIKTAYEAESNTNAFTDAEKTKLSGVATSANNYSISSDLLDEDNMASNSATKAASQQSIKAYVDANSGTTNLTSTANGTSLTVESSSGNNASLPAATTSAWGVMTDDDKTKLDGIEANATADQTAAEIRTLVESASDSNVFTDADHTKLNAIEASATADQTDAEIKTAYENNSDTNAFTDAEKTKLSGVEASADVTDATNVNAAGAVMNSDLDGKGELLVGDGSGDPTALAAGTNGYVLKANSSTATGLEWSAAGSGGDVNQNAFSNIAVTGQTTVAADSATDTLNIAAGSNVTITTDASNDIVTIASSYTNTTDLASDSSPQLGGDLDVQAREITTSTTNGDIVLNPNGEFGVVKIKGDSTNSVDGTLELACSTGSHGVKIKSPPHSAAQNYTLTLPSSIVNGAFLKTDSNGVLSFATPTDTNTQLSNAEVRTAVEAASDSNVFTDADHTKLNGIAASANNYVHPNHSGEVTSTADGATVITDNVVDEANLKVSNTPTNGYVLTAQSGNTGGLTWAAQSGGGGLSSDSDGNTIGGTNAGDNITSSSGLRNTLIGYNAGTDLNTGDDTVALGYEALKANTTGPQVTAVGYQALYSNTTADRNTAVGYRAGYSVTTNSWNTAIGFEAVKEATNGSCTALGGQAIGRGQAQGCVAVGYKALYGASGGQNFGCTAIGQKALENANASNNHNTALGYEAGDSITSGTNNIIIGANADASAATVSNEITLGDSNITKFRIPGLNFVIKDSTATDNYVLTLDANGEAGWEAATGGGGGGLSSDAQNNTVGGSNAGDSFSGTDAVSNTLIGKNAGTAITTADECVAIGHDAGSSNTTAKGMTSIGFEAGKSYTVTGGTFIGHQAGKGLVDGQQNTAIGEGAMASPTNNGTYANTYIGYAAGINHGNGHQNTGIGTYVLKSNAAWSNIAIGNNAGENNTSGTRSTFIGRYAGHQNTTGSYNWFAGYYAGADITTGDNNTCIGDQSGHTGTNNLTTGSNNTLIGAQAAASAADVSNEVTIGDSNIATLRCNVQTISSLSDRRDKTDINTLNLGLDFVKSLNPVKFKWETRDGNGKDGSYEAGFIAQDFQQLQKENDADYLKLVMDENPDRLEASYGKLIPVLVKAIQELTIEVEKLKSNG